MCCKDAQCWPETVLSLKTKICIGRWQYLSITSALFSCFMCSVLWLCLVLSLKLIQISFSNSHLWVFKCQKEVYTIIFKKNVIWGYFWSPTTAVLEVLQQYHMLSSALPNFEWLLMTQGFWLRYCSQLWLLFILPLCWEKGGTSFLMKPRCASIMLWKQQPSREMKDRFD